MKILICLPLASESGPPAAFPPKRITATQEQGRKGRRKVILLGIVDTLPAIAPMRASWYCFFGTQIVSITRFQKKSKEPTE